VVADLIAFYEEEAVGGRRGEPTGRRVDARKRFIDLLIQEERQSVLELGAGPGHEGPAFAVAGFNYVGIDLAVGNARLARNSGTTVIPASLYSPPFRPESFDAGWSMSTLMHVPQARFAEAMSAVLDPLRIGAPLAIGLWGSATETDREIVSRHEGSNTQRQFSLRTAEHNRNLLNQHVAIEHLETWDVGSDEHEEYHFAIVRKTRQAVDFTG